MKLHAHPLPAPAAIPAAPPGPDHEAKKRAIAQALWTGIHWLMPTDRALTIIVDGDNISCRVRHAPPGRLPGFALKVRGASHHRGALRRANPERRRGVRHEAGT